MNKPELIKEIEKYIVETLKSKKLDVSEVDNKELRSDAKEWLDSMVESHSLLLDEIEEHEE